MIKDIKRKLDRLEDYLCDISLDLENVRDEFNNLYSTIEDNSKSSIKDIDNFKRELKRDGLYNNKLEEFIEQYMIYYNK